MAHNIRHAKQLRLIADIPSAPANGSGFHDPAFASNKRLPVHRWVPWIAGYSRDFVRGAMHRFMQHGGTVMDPFTGVGTTLVEAVLAGHDATGFEINPYAALASHAKVTAHSVDIEAFESAVARFREFYHDCNARNYRPQSEPPATFKTRADFYSPEVLRKVLTLQDFINTVEIPEARDLFRLAFASTMVSYSNYSYEPSLGRRVSSGKSEILDFPVAETVLAKLLQMVEDIWWLQEVVSDRKPHARVYNDSFFNYRDYVELESVDLIITSPPYLNNYHYNRNTRPQLYWLGFAHDPKDMKPLEEQSFGKYWQTVRELDRLDLDFSLPATDLAERLEVLRSLNPERGVYGGNGWANYAASYFNDCYRFAKAIQEVLIPGGTALVVIGNSIIQGVMIPTDQYLGSIAEAAGLRLVGIEIPRATRVGNSIIQSGVRVAKAQDSHQLYEAIVELRKL